jgi:hypothetical protein
LIGGNPQSKSLKTSMTGPPKKQRTAFPLE